MEKWTLFLTTSSNVDEAYLYADLGQTEAIGTTIYNVYTNISYEFGGGESSTETESTLAQTIATVDRSDSVDWTNPYYAQSQDGSSATAYIDIGGVSDTEVPYQDDFTTTEGSIVYGDLENDNDVFTNLTPDFTAGSSGQGTFGYDQIGSSYYNVAPNEKAGSKFTLAQGGDVVNIKAYMALGPGAKDPKQARACVYSDNSGNPDQLLGESTATNIVGTTYSWYTFTFSPEFSLPAGDYWLVIHSGSKIRIYGENSGWSSMKAPPST